MKLNFYIILSLFCESLSGQLYFNNAYESPSISSETCGQVEVVQNGYITPMWFGEYEATNYYGIRHIDLNGNPIVVETVDSMYTSFSGTFARNFISTSDGGFAFGGMLDTACIIKISPTFQEEWRKNVGEYGGSFYSINELSNGQYFCTWLSQIHESDGLDLYWFNPDGSQQNHTHVLVDGMAGYQVTNVNQLEGGDLILNLYLQQVFFFDNIIMRLNSTTGEVIWQKRFSIGNFNKQLGFSYSKIESSSDAIVAFMTVDTLTDQFNPYGGYFGRIGTMNLNLANGDTSNVQFFDDTFHVHSLLDFEPTPDGGYILLIWETNPDYGWKKQLVKLDHNRLVEWRKEYNPLPVDQMEMIFCEVYDVDVCPDSGYVVSGRVQDAKSVPTFHNGKQISWVFKTDPCGDLEWNNCGLSNIAQNPTSADSSPLFVIAPNPTNGIMTLTSDNVFTNVQIKDVTGKVVASHLEIAPQNRRTIDCSSLSKGVYFVTVQFDSKVVSQRLFIQ